MSSHNFIAILGRQPELGLVELESLLGGNGVEPVGPMAVRFGQAIEIDRFGGIQKLGRVLYEGAAKDIQTVPSLPLELPTNEGKLVFGLSIYGTRLTPRAITALGLEFKKRLREQGSVRLVTPTAGTALSAAQLHHNQVLERGFELLVVVAGPRMLVAVTTAVQNIDWYSRRDYDRPARSARVGMLPPKLAQVLVNTTTAPAVFDPFCGTGVVLQEARLLGREVAGSDLADDMVVASQTNMQWLETVAPTPLPSWRVELADARTVEVPAGAAVVSEGYLGPNLTQSPTPAQLKSIRAEMLALYRAALARWAMQLPAGGEVSLCAPAWRRRGGWDYLGLVDELSDLGYTLKGFKHVRTPLLYARDDQVVGRQLLLLRKN